MKWPHRLNIVIPGRIKFSFIKEGVEFYQQRLRHYLDFQVRERKLPGKIVPQPEKVKTLEAECLLSSIPERAPVIALDERGREFTSKALAEELRRLFESQRESFFLIGGPYGLAEKVLSRAQMRLSLSRLTLGHEIALLVLCEQLYRSVTILSGEPYHK
ncbi:MAG: 23S rRNA (pseudouridine(1915)-N(3))-methyltransferase RlmH [Thermodesulfobacteria bacterium]|nr:23S rRNA (pseudouridine(1915)-N(3))-methyltransferase RlmH [Thermodesulfobacteriota bacterium]